MLRDVIINEEIAKTRELLSFDLILEILIEKL